MSIERRLSVCCVLLGLTSWGALAHGEVPDASGAALLSLMPVTLASHPRQAPQGYSRFATAAYRLEGDAIATLQIHEVVGAGAAAHQQQTCRRFRSVGGHRACVTERPGTVSLVWVLSDTIQVMLGAPDEATALRMAADLPISDIARLAATLARPSP